MPLTYTVDEARNAVHARISGTLADDDVLSGGRRILADARVRPGYTMLVDATEADGQQLNASLAHALAKLAAGRSDKTQDARTAIVFPAYPTRIVDEYSRQAEHSVIVFHSEDVARAWLGWPAEVSKPLPAPKVP